MNNSAVNFTTFGASTNTTACSFGHITLLEILVYSFNAVFGLPTHFYVIWLIVTEAKSGIASEFFFLNLSVCEIGICLDCVFVVLTKWDVLFFTKSCFYNASLFLQGLIITGRPFFHSLICVERYLAVVYPVTFLKYKPLRYKLMCSAVTWIICLSTCLCSFFLLSACMLNIYTMFFLLQFFFFLFIQLFCCLAVLRALKQSGPGERGREREEENHMKRRAFYLILISVTSMIITYVPYIVLGICVILRTSFITGFWYSGLICYTLAGFVHSVLYLHRAGKLSCCPM